MMNGIGLTMESSQRVQMKLLLVVLAHLMASLSVPTNQAKRKSSTCLPIILDTMNYME